MVVGGGPSGDGYADGIGGYPFRPPWYICRHMTRRTTILADPDLLDRVDRLARRMRTTKTAVIGAALEAYLDAHESSEEPAFVAVGRSGHGRLSLDARRVATRATAPAVRGTGRPDGVG
jgi:hypothetical protein